VRKVSIGLGTLAAVGALALPASALAAQQFTITPAPVLSGKAGGSGSLTFSFTIANSLGGEPSPLAGPLTVDLPMGVSYSALAASAKLFPKCAASVVEAATGSTPPNCPAGSLVGTGSATFSALIGTQTLNESAAVKIYLSSSSPVGLTFWSAGTTPIAETKVWPGTISPGTGQYGETVVTTPPTISTVPGGPDASVIQYSSTFTGTTKVKVKKGKKTTTKTVYFIPLPKKCPSPQLHWGATAGYEDGTSTTTTATTACTL
jgi:hypothetical protein